MDRAAGTDRSGGYATGTGGAKSGRCLLGQAGPRRWHAPPALGL